MASSAQPTILRLGTRGSPLALVQARLVGDALALHGIGTEVVVMTTTGDRVQDRALAEIGGKALWTKELDAALLDHRIDLAVHSMKDVETHLADGIALAAVLPRGDVRDRLIGAASLAEIPRGGKVGTSSPRRAAQLLSVRPDLKVELLRGNVATRLGRIAAGDFDATLLAAAGLDRLGIAAGVALEVEDWLPAPAQGAVGITVRVGEEALVRVADHPDSHAAVLLERAFLAELVADCHSPVAALAIVAGDSVSFTGEILASDGRERQRGQIDTADVAGLARRLLGQASPALRAQFG